MIPCDGDTPVPGRAGEQPGAPAVFQALGIAHSCGGESPAYARRERGLDAGVVLARLFRCVGDEKLCRVPFIEGR